MPKTPLPMSGAPLSQWMMGQLLSGPPVVLFQAWIGPEDSLRIMRVSKEQFSRMSWDDDMGGPFLG